MKRELKVGPMARSCYTRSSSFKTDPDEKGTESYRFYRSSQATFYVSRLIPMKRELKDLCYHTKHSNQNGFKTDPDEKGTERLEDGRP